MNISPALQQGFSRALLQIQKHAPAILTTVGVASVVGATILAAKNTLKLEETLDEGQDRLRWTNEQIAAGDVPEHNRVAVYIKNAFEVGRLYAIPTTLLVGGILCVLSSQNILNKRNAAVVAAYNGLAASYEAYRERVREEYGEEREREIFFGEKTVTEEVDGKKVKRKVLVDGEHVGSPYRFYYDSTNENWSGFHDHNLFRVTAIQNMFNDQLHARKHVFLRDVLDTLGIEATPASVVTGWILDEKNPDHKGDNFIEFNIRDYQSEYGYILLDFNVDGTIFDKI